MGREEAEDTAMYVVVVNHEEQYSIWPEGKRLPLGWLTAAKRGGRAECLEWVGQVWTDMTPASLRLR